MGRERKGATQGAPPVIRDWTEGDYLLGEVAADRAKLASIQGGAEAKIEKVKAEAKEESAEISARLTGNLKSLEAFTRAHEGELEGRSRKLTHGILGLRRTTAIMLKNSAEYVINALRARGMVNCVRVKEEIDKTALEPCDDKTLAEVGCRRQVRDIFYAETDEVRL